MVALHYLETCCLDPAYNLAFEETILRRRREGDYLLLWQNDNTVVVGLNQNTEAEINRPFVEEHGIRVVRRITGGGAVYHDLGNLNYSFITNFSPHHQYMGAFTAPVLAALRSLGLYASASGRNDILANGQKVSGTAQRILDGRILHHGTLLFDSNLDMVAGALQADPRKYQSKSTPSVRSRVGNIQDMLAEPMDIKAFWICLRKYFSQNGLLVEESLTEEELAEVWQLKETKYDTWDWVYGRSPRFDFRSSRRFPGGLLEACVTVQSGRIQEIVFYGDFLALEPLEPLTAALTGCPFYKEAVLDILQKFPLQRLFGSVTAEEILEVLFS